MRWTVNCTNLEEYAYISCYVINTAHVIIVVLSIRKWGVSIRFGYGSYLLGAYKLAQLSVSLKIIVTPSVSNSFPSGYFTILKLALFFLTDPNWTRISGCNASNSNRRELEIWKINRLYAPQYRSMYALTFSPRDICRKVNGDRLAHFLKAPDIILLTFVLDMLVATFMTDHVRILLRHLFPVRMSGISNYYFVGLIQTIIFENSPFLAFFAENKINKKKGRWTRLPNFVNFLKKKSWKITIVSFRQRKNFAFQFCEKSTKLFFSSFRL